MATKGILGAGSIPTLTETLAQRTKAVEEYKPKLEESLKAKEEVAGAEQKMKAERELAQQTALQTAEDTYAAQDKALPQREQMQQVREKQAVPFVPTQDNAKSLTELFMLIGITGFAIGIGGKGKAQEAMSAMDGMVKGYQQGRADLYTKEKQRFDTSMKQLKQQYDELDRELTDAMKIAQTDREAAVQKARVAFAKTGADFYKQYEEKFGLARLYDYHKQAMKDLEKSQTLAQKELETAQQRAYEEGVRREERRYQEGVRRQERGEKFTVVGVDKDGNTVIRTADGKMQTLEGVTPASVEVAKSKAKPEKTMGEAQLVKLEGLDSVASGLESLLKEFKPEYASLGAFGYGADFDMELKRRLGDKAGTDAARWWAKYERLQAPNRHALFGATLTGNELKNYQSFTAKKSDSPETVRAVIEDQIEYSNNLSEQRRDTFQRAGYRVPEARAKDFDKTFSGAKPSAETAKTITSKEEYDALPPNTPYIWNGRRLIKEAK